MHVALTEVQQWLEKTKLQLTSVDASLDDTASATVFAMLNKRFDTTVWLDQTSTPTLVRKIISALIAGWLYERAYSEDSSQKSAYSQDLEDWAYNTLAGLLEATVDLVGVIPVNEVNQQPVFLPNDITGLLQRVDGLGNLTGVVGDEDIKFTMGKMF